MTYERSFARGLSGKYERIMQALGPKSRVLEVGCYTGYFTLELQQRGHSVRGIEVDAKAAAEAAARGANVSAGDVEVIDAAQLGGPYDAILFMDVLEHLKDPESVLRQMRSLLAPGGRILATGPNVAYWAVRKNLLVGRWNYADSGVMDRTHLRFFTAETWVELFKSAGYAPRLEPVEGMLPLLSRIANRFPRLDRSLTRLGLAVAPGFFATMYYIEAVPS